MLSKVFNTLININFVRHADRKMSKNLRELEKQLEELRQENAVDRIRVSQAGQELLQYCESHFNDDFFLHKGDKTNHFKENKTPCNVL